MNALGWYLFAALAVAALWCVFVYLLPGLRVRRMLRQLAAGDLQAPERDYPAGGLLGAAEDLITISRRLREMDGLLADEVFNLQALLGSLSQGVLIIDSSERIRLANTSLHRLFELPAPPVERTLMEVFRNHTLQAAVRAAFSADGVPQSLDLSLDTRQGNQYVRKHFTITAAALRPPNSMRSQGAIVIFHDITELQALETMRQDFVANVSHELRTPVSIINGYLETLLDGAMADPPTAEKFLRVIWKHNERLTRLIEDLLSVSALEARDGPGLTLERIALRASLERVIERLEPRVRERGALVDLEAPENLPPVEGDALRLEQAFSNLIENALQHSDASPPKIRIRAQREGDDAVITISDNGPGIPYADQPHIFERFYRVHKDRSRAVGGTGLGLSIVKHVVQAHRGQVSVESQPGRGATFLLRLPLLRAS